MFRKCKWLVVIALLIFIYSCSLEGEIYTVTFNINNGSGIAPKTYATINGRSIILPDGEGLTRSGYAFTGWNTDSSGLGTNYDAGSVYTVTKNVVLYARWRNPALTFELGDIGPGGGRIFYRSEEGFTMSDNGEICNYLETVSLGNYRWASEIMETTFVSGTSREVGTGRKNAAIILAADEDAPAAKICNEYSVNGVTSWFLPSLDELILMYENKSYIGNFSNDFFWSSTQYSMSTAYALSIGSGRFDTYGKRNNSVQVRAVRAF